MIDTKFDPRYFRSALGQFPTGVTVITASDEKGKPIGCTASSFNSVSMDPPLVLWSVDKGAFSADIFANSEYFAVNVLSESQVATSNRFAGRGEDKFKGLSYCKGLGNAPLLESCGAQFECRTWNVYDGGDHLIIVGEVLKYDHDNSLTPLVFSRGSYAITAQHPSGNSQNKENGSGNAFLDDYLLYLLNSTISKYRKELYPMLIDGCDITPEQWRIMTVLSSVPSHDIDGLSEIVMQPIKDLSASLDFLKDKDILRMQEDNIGLTDKGIDLQKTLFDIARQHETTMLSKLKPEQASALKEGLKSVVTTN
jgi:flavin reductase (DIM6/NTAB) family NADH-FMN oxidoreductase RutF/DNA-binding MarR family transcriptional regulator